MFVTWNCIRIMDDVLREFKYRPSPSSFSSGRSMADSVAVLLCASVVLAFVLSVFVLHFSFFCVLGRLCLVIVSLPGILTDNFTIFIYFAD